MPNEDELPGEDEPSTDESEPWAKTSSGDADNLSDDDES